MANGNCLAQGRALQYFPKKTQATYHLTYLADCRQKINTRPRKSSQLCFSGATFFPLSESFTPALALLWLNL